MDQPTIPLTPSRRSVWKHLTFALMGVALLGLSLLPGSVSANQQGATFNDAQWPIAICKAGGGKGTSIDVGAGASSAGSTATRCSGGYFDGVTCWNSTFYGTECWGRKIVAGPSVLIELPLMTYAEGSVQGIDASVWALSQVIQPAKAPGVGQSIDTHTADQEKEQARGKGKHRGNGKGKKGGKRHR